jgi:hypothetical protein
MRLSDTTPDAMTTSAACSTAPSTKLTSISAGQPECGAPRRNRTGDPILTMEPPGTAVRTAVSPGHAQPSGPKLSVLFQRSYAFSFRHARPAVLVSSHEVQCLVAELLHRRQMMSSCAKEPQ